MKETTLNNTNKINKTQDQNLVKKIIIQSIKYMTKQKDKLKQELLKPEVQKGLSYLFMELVFTIIIAIIASVYLGLAIDFIQAITKKI